MIISASRRTDIPAFYAEDFLDDLEIGYTDVANPFNPKQTRVVDLTPEAVDAIVFWTRYPQPILKYLELLNRAGYDYVFLYTITGYSKILEPNTPDMIKAVDCFRQLSDQIGPAKVIWRYDPIVISRISDEDYHTENFDTLAGMLSDYTDKVIISFLDFYKKLTPRFAKLKQEYNLTIDDIRETPEKAVSLARQIKQIADSYGLAIQSCAESDIIAESGITPGGCIDSGYLSGVFDKPFTSHKDKNQRDNCLCHESADIGSYNTCKFGCTYCYASGGDIPQRG
ncbi:MAG: DUF1848 domain-containing protein [candidate division Zixibacteria bacterium]|nr:DUF1848 domain-containing protein [candidate division Zixibacteria bacterium]